MNIRTTTVMALAAIGICWLLAAPASSQESDYSRDAFYLGVSVIGGTYTDPDSDITGPGIPGNANDIDTISGVKAYTGVKFNRHFAVEADIEFLRNSDTDVSGSSLSGEIETWTFTINGKAFPLTGRIQPYLLTGVGFMQASFKDTDSLGIDRTETDLALRFGGGLDFLVTRHVVASIGVNYVLPLLDLEDLDYVSYGGGLQYRF